MSPTDRDELARRIESAAQSAVSAEPTMAEAARLLRAKDKTVTAIAEQLGCTERTIYRYLAAA